MEVDKSSTIPVVKRCSRFPNYSVSDDGRVFSNTPWRGSNFRELKQEDVGYGYMRVCLLDENGNRRKILVHRLVAEEFLGESDLPEVRHLDDNPSNNHVSNLAWSTKQDNMQDRIVRNGNNILSDSDKRIIAEIYKTGTSSHRELAKQFGVTKETIREIVK